MTLDERLIEKKLTTREIEVAKHVIAGLSNKEVADRLFVAVKTIKFHLTSIYNKVNVPSRSKLTAWAVPPKVTLPPIIVNRKFVLPRGT